MKKIVFLCHAPKVAPGILMKMFVDLPGVSVFYQPFHPYLDLFAKHSLTLRGDPRIPAGYFDSYAEHPEIWRHYPISEIPPTTNELLPFLRACIDSSGLGAVFEISGEESSLSELSLEFPESVFISYENTLPDQIRAKVVSEVQILDRYPEAVRETRRFCGFQEGIDQEVFHTSDWVILNQRRIDGGHNLRPTFPVGSRRALLEELFEKREALLRATSRESEISSLRTQLERMTEIASERGELIEKLSKELRKKEEIGTLSPNAISHTLKSRITKQFSKQLKRWVG